jgi:Glycosyltransferase family 87
MRDRLLRDGYLVIAAVFVGARLFSIAPWDQSVDAFAYWSTRDGDLYGDSTGVIGAYLYSPAFAQAAAAITWLPWPIFDAIWTAVGFALLWWLVGRWALPMLLFPPVAFEIISGNVHLPIAAAIVAGFRYPAAWVLPLLTKVTPGVGLVWFLVRREWRALGIALGGTVAMVVLSWLIDAQAWGEWSRLLVEGAGRPLATVGWYVPIPLLPRVVAAALIVTWGALTDRPWAIPIGVTLALPVVWLNSLAILVASLPIASARRAADGTETRLDSAAVRFLRSGNAHV